MKRDRKTYRQHLTDKAGDSAGIDVRIDSDIYGIDIVFPDIDERQASVYIEIFENKLYARVWHRGDDDGYTNILLKTLEEKGDK